MHALVLDTVETITEYNQSEGYEVGDVKLIFKNTHDDEENGKTKKYTINAKSTMAPDVFTMCTLTSTWIRLQIVIAKNVGDAIVEVMQKIILLQIPIVLTLTKSVIVPCCDEKISKMTGTKLS